MFVCLSFNLVGGEEVGSFLSFKQSATRWDYLRVYLKKKKNMLGLGPICERCPWGLGFCGLCQRTESVSEIHVIGTMLGAELVLNKYSSIKCLVLLVLF